MKSEIADYCNPLPVIGSEEAFYGFIVGLGVHPREDDDGLESTLFAEFNRQELRDGHYCYERKRWEVPDERLFKILSKYLCETAWERKENGCMGRTKLMIEHRNGKWIVGEP